MSENRQPILSLVIPCYNEQDNIPYLVESIADILKGRHDIEVLLVNNGSTDNSAEVFSLEKEKHPDLIRIVEVPVNRGYGYGILSGLAAAKGSILAWTHADLQTDIKDVLTALDTYLSIQNNAVFVKGRRKNRALGPLFFTWGMGTLASMALGTKLVDIGGQPKLFSREFYEKNLQHKAPNDFSLDLYAQYWAQKTGKLIEIPVFFKTRLHGEAKGGGSLKTRIKVSKRVFKFIFEMRRHLKKSPSDHTK